MKSYLFLFLLLATSVFAQRNVTNANDSNTPLHLLKPDYPIPYGIPQSADVQATITRIHQYLDAVTPTEFVNTKTNETLNDLSKIDENTALKKGDFRLVSYEWGVTYGAMLLASKVTGDSRFKEYADKRLQFIAHAAPFFKKTNETHADWGTKSPLRGLLTPHALDDCGAMCAAMIKATREGNKANLRPLIDTHIDYILHKEHRLADGTLARNRPQANTLWLDDLFMAVPALAQMGKLTGEAMYYDEACKQVLAFAKRMFNKEKGIYQHGWVEGMTEHPAFYWARANGWAIMTKVELLEVLPENHPARAEILALLKAHVKGLTALQSGSGFWHQLLDKEDSYLETSATAIYTFSIARAVNRGWVDKLAYSPAVLLGWNALATKVNERGQVEGTCVGTGMGFEPAFYYHRPISPFAAHGYGPALLAGAEVLSLLQNHVFEINDSTVQLLLPSTRGLTGVRDTSYSLQSAYTGTLKTHPNIQKVPTTLPASVQVSKDLVYATVGERKLGLDVFYPKKKATKLRIALLIVHGGGWRTGNKNQHDALAQRLADLGYVCFLPEYRLSTEALYPAAVYDLKAAIRWVKINAATYQIDTNKVAVAGFSAGGQLAALLGATWHKPEFEGTGGNTQASSKVEAVIDMDGILAFIHPESGEGDDSQRTSAATYWFGYNKTQNPQLWQAGSALTHVSKYTPPTLFINSAVARMHAGREDYCNQLKTFNTETQIHTFPDSPHGFPLFEPWFSPTVKLIDDFLKRVLK